MKSDFIEKYTIFAWLWIFVLSILTILMVAPEGLNADILINSVMSLQKLTLYYWGQNRLLNVLPLATFIFRDPSINLAVTLLLTSMSFYALLYILACSASRIAGAKNEGLLSFSVFATTSLVFILVFKSPAISEIVIGHIEYSFAALLLAISCLQIFPVRDGKVWHRLTIASVATFLSIGLNPSTVIPAFAIAIASIFYKRKFGFNEFFWILISGISFWVWGFISKLYGSSSYNQFEFQILQVGIPKVFSGLLGAINLPEMLFVVAILYLVRFGRLVLNQNKSQDSSYAISYIGCVVVLFSVGWFLLFASNRWVEINEFAWRYFIYIIFLIYFILSLQVAHHLKDAGIKTTLSLSALVVLSSIFLAVQGFSGFGFKDYKVFQRANDLTEPGGHLYAGDYWFVWPSVLRDMMSGYEAYGLTHRGEANEAAAREFVARQINEHGHAKVYCLRDPLKKCISKTNAVVGPLHVLGSTELKSNVHLIKFSKYAPFLDFRGEDLLGLPSHVGVVENSARVTQSRAGFLSYGPYVSLRKGRYLLDVTGSTVKLNGAFVDVVSNKGTRVHARFDLKKDSENGLILRSAVDLPEDISDLEVRIWVGADDELKLLGYTLKPF